MRKLVILCTVALMALLLAAPVVGCQQQTEPIMPFTSWFELAYQKTTLEEASSILEVTVPRPTYLPKGYKIQEVYIEPNTEKPTRSEVRLLISDEEIEMKLMTHTDSAGTRQYYEFQCKMLMVVRWFSDGKVLPVRLPVERVEINDERGFLVEKEDYNDLWWNWQPMRGERGVFELVLAASKDISKEELAKVATSAIH